MDATDNIQQMKRCSKCGELKRLTDAGRWCCDQCARDRATAYRLSNIERVRAYDRERAAAMPADVKRAKHKRWRDTNREYVRGTGRETAKRLYERDPEKYRALSRRYFQENRGSELARMASERARLADSYVRTALRLTKDEAPAVLIELKREQLSLRRLTRELVQELEKRDGD